jgi:glutamate carboxypeptidase
MSTLTDDFQNRQEAILSVLMAMVEIESPSEEKTAVDRMGSHVTALMRSAGAVVEVFPQAQVGNAILGRWEGQPGKPPILLLCHMDTVWPVGTIAGRPPRVEDGCYYGPGAYDMKGGLAIALAAIQGLRDRGELPGSPVLVLCTGDEEIGSHASRPIIEKLAAGSQLVMVLEPSLPGGVLKTARKGVGDYIVRAKGRAAHAGADHRQGINAIEEMAHQVIAIQALTDYERGTTVSTGVIHGGTASNVVPAECEITVDFRVSVPGEAERLQQAMLGLKARLPGASLEVEGGLNRPPMVRDEQMVRTFEKARRIASAHGFSLEEASTGGASDGNFTAALGIPTLDGLGVDGDGGHALHEHAVIASLPARAALLAALIGGW